MTARRPPAARRGEALRAAPRPCPPARPATAPAAGGGIPPHGRADAGGVPRKSPETSSRAWQRAGTPTQAGAAGAAAHAGGGR